MWQEEHFNSTISKYTKCCNSWIISCAEMFFASDIFLNEWVLAKLKDLFVMLWFLVVQTLCCFNTYEKFVWFAEPNLGSVVWVLVEFISQLQSFIWSSHMIMWHSLILFIVTYLKNFKKLVLDSLKSCHDLSWYTEPASSPETPLKEIHWRYERVVSYKTIKPVIPIPDHAWAGSWHSKYCSNIVFAFYF